jgi:hypothetical protein
VLAEVLQTQPAILRGKPLVTSTNSNEHLVSAGALTGKSTTLQLRPPHPDAKIIGLDICRVDPCRCGCPLTRITYHSTNADKLILRCPWCLRRRGWPPEAEVKALHVFVRTHGWNMRPIILGENGVAYVR